MSSKVIVRGSGRGVLRQDIIAGAFNLVGDEPVAAGGTNAGPAPYDYLASALGECKSMTVTLYAQRKGWALDGVEVSVAHEKIKTGDKFTCDIVLKGNLDAEQRARLIEIAGRCPVHKTLESDHCVVETKEISGPSTAPPKPAP